MRRGIVPALIVSLALAACSLTVGLDNLTSSGEATDGGSGDATFVMISPDGAKDSSNETDDASDSSEKDAGSASDASTGDQDTGLMNAPSDMITNGGFEMQNGVGCGPGWTAYQSIATSVARPHTGMYACLVCPRDMLRSTSPTVLDGSAPNMALITAYARIVASDGSDAGYIATPATCGAKLSDGGAVACGTTYVTPISPDGGISSYIGNNAPAGIGTDWKLLGGEFPTSIYSAELTFGFTNVPSGDCVLLDDVTLAYQN